MVRGSISMCDVEVYGKGSEHTFPQHAQVAKYYDYAEYVHVRMMPFWMTTLGVLHRELTVWGLAKYYDYAEEDLDNIMLEWCPFEWPLSECSIGSWRLEGWQRHVYFRMNEGITCSANRMVECLCFDRLRQYSNRVHGLFGLFRWRKASRNPQKR